MFVNAVPMSTRQMHRPRNESTEVNYFRNRGIIYEKLSEQYGGSRFVLSTIMWSMVRISHGKNGSGAIAFFCDSGKRHITVSTKLQCGSSQSPAARG